MQTIYDQLIEHIRNHLDMSRPIQNVLASQTTSQSFLDFLQQHLLPRSATITRQTGSIHQKQFDLVIHECITSNSFDIHLIQKLSEHTNDTGQILVVSRRQASTTVAVCDTSLRSYGLQPLLVEPVGKLSIISGNELRVLPVIGKLFTNSTSYSPLLIMIYRRQDTHINYVPETSLGKRIKRIKFRTRIRLEKNVIGRKILGARHILRMSTERVKLILGIYDRRYRNIILPTIPFLDKTPDGKTRVVIAMTWMIVGGVERVMLSIIKGLDKTAFEIHVLTCLPHSHPWHAEFAAAGAKITHVASLIDDSWPSSFGSRYVADYVLRSKADTLLITNSSPAYQALPIIRSQLPYCKIFDILHTHATPKEDDAFLKISLPYDELMNERVVIDQYLKDYYCERYPVSPERIRVIYNGVSDDICSSAATLVRQRRRTFQPQQGITITYAGRLDSDKSTERLVEIAKRAKDRSILLQLNIYGEGPLRQSMEDRARHYHLLDTSVKLLGYTDKPLDVMAASDFTILTSDAEGIPMCVLESMVCGVPTIVPAVGGIPEIVDDTIDGFLCDIASAVDENEIINMFVDAIEKASRMDKIGYEAMRKQCYKKINEKFRSMNKEYSQLLTKDSH